MFSKVLASSNAPVSLELLGRLLGTYESMNTYSTSLKKSVSMMRFILHVSFGGLISSALAHPFYLFAYLILSFLLSIREAWKTNSCCYIHSLPQRLCSSRNLPLQFLETLCVSVLHESG